MRSIFLDADLPEAYEIQQTLGDQAVDEKKRESDERRALIEMAITLGILLLLEQFLLPFPEVKRQTIEVGTVLIWSQLWWLFYGVTHPHQ